jgi:hypothetical protein
VRLLPARRRSHLALALLLFSHAATGFVHYRPLGPHYLGHPDGWWALRPSVLPLRGAVVAPPPTLAEWLRDRAFALVGATPPSVDDPRGNDLLRGDPQAVPVLAELVSHPDPRVRYWAADGLRCVRPRALEAVPALVAAVRRYGGDGRRESQAGDGDADNLLMGIVTRIDEPVAADKVRSALEDIEPEAAKRALYRVGEGAGDEQR